MLRYPLLYFIDIDFRQCCLLAAVLIRLPFLTASIFILAMCSMCAATATCGESLRCVVGSTVTARAILPPLCESVLCLPIFSQNIQGTIQGAVLDQSGGSVAGATVSVADVSRGATRTFATDSAGEYLATNLTPGTYIVRAEARGFRTIEHSGVLVQVGENIRVDLVVQPGEQNQTITVTGEAPTVDTTDATLGGAVSNNAINTLPFKWQ